MSIESFLQKIIDELPPLTEEEERKITALEAEKLKAQPPRDSRSLSDFKGDYVPMIKMRLSGLSQHSSGNGRNRVTVEHALMIKPLSAGRLNREPLAWLCGVKNGWGRSSSVNNSVNCPKCQAYIEKLGLEACEDEAIARLVECF